MKKILLMLLCMSLTAFAGAQLVIIPDTNFRNYLQTHFPSAMNNNLMNPNDPQIQSANTLVLDSLFITDLEGVQYFTNLSHLDCSNNLLHSLPPIPSGVTELICKVNKLDSLGSLPPNLSYLNCSSNLLTHLPTLPASLTILDCCYNLLTQIPAYGPLLYQINCSFNQLDTLPAFTATISEFDCSHNLLDSIPTLPPSMQSLNISFNGLYTLPSLNNGLSILDCSRDSLSFLNSLPASLTSLTCSGNALDSLPGLPSGLYFLNCSANYIDSLPNLNSSLNNLDCNTNLLTTLPALPASLAYLDCSKNAIPTLSNLPSNLYYLNYSANPVSVLPTLPLLLQHLVWDNNPTNVLPILPDSLKFLSASYNSLDSLPTLPPALEILKCTYDSLFTLPLLPSGLLGLNCSGNYLTSIPITPPQLSSLDCSYNHINQLPTLSNAISSLHCDNNTNLHCLPPLPSSMQSITFNNTAITCMPNYVQLSALFYSSQTYNLPLCTGSNGCPHAWNLAGGLHADTSANCTLDSLNPGVGVRHLKVQLYQGNTLLDSFKINRAGKFSFRAPLNATYDVKVNTTGLPVSVACPTNLIQTATPTSIDSMKDHLDFGIVCNGVDAGIKSIYTDRLRPGLNSEITIRGGDMAMYYNLNCLMNQQAHVVTTLNGPVTYVQPAPGALIPSSVVGNVISYLIPDLGVVDFSSAFSIIVNTDADATMGNQVCVSTVLTGLVGDMDLSNNFKKKCFAVVNSFDPNSKEVDPMTGSMAGDLLTYTIHFQNTGSDTAYRVVLIDTLSDHLDWNTFQLGDASHDVDVVRSGPLVKFIFDDILLTAKSHSEAMSMGWVQFTIQLKKDLPLFTKTPNRAFIYFDQNPAIMTNDANNVIGMDTTTLIHENPIALPNAITPNGDNLNEVWSILNKEYLDMKKITIESVIVRNRWGQVVFRQYGKDWIWSGENNHQETVYSYQIIYKINGEMESLQSGTITVLP